MLTVKYSYSENTEVKRRSVMILLYELELLSNGTQPELF